MGSLHKCFSLTASQKSLYLRCLFIHSSMNHHCISSKKRKIVVCLPNISHNEFESEGIKES